MRVVASLTTMPDRYSKIARVLESLTRQTHRLDAIYLGLPERSRRLNIDYPPVPSEISDHCTVVRCGDFGPITKILAGLISEEDPNTVIITFDDDMVYPSNIVERLVEHHHRYPRSAIGSSGMLLKYNCPMCAITPNEDTFLYRIPKFYIPVEGRRVDSIYGYPGALYLRSFFPSNSDLEITFLNYALTSEDTLMNDDIVISGFLSLNNVERRIFPNMPVVSFVLDNGVRSRSTNEISYDLGAFFYRMNKSIDTCKSLGMYSNPESLSITETIIGVSLIIIVCAIILLVACVYLIML